MFQFSCQKCFLDQKKTDYTTHFGTSLTIPYGTLFIFLHIVSPFAYLAWIFKERQCTSYILAFVTQTRPLLLWLLCKHKKKRVKEEKFLDCITSSIIYYNAFLSFNIKVKCRKIIFLWCKYSFLIFMKEDEGGCFRLLLIISNACELKWKEF